MADITTFSTPRRNLVVQAFASFYDALIGIAESNARVQQVERLQAMSDEDLAARGLRRADIARHVYRDIFYV
jgi:uncharacterized protein YjiS (DUF1127 family)